jgi:hypothetical protein
MVPDGTARQMQSPIGTPEGTERGTNTSQIALLRDGSGVRACIQWWRRAEWRWTAQ